MKAALPSDLADLFTQQLVCRLPENELDYLLSQVTEAELLPSLDTAYESQLAPAAPTASEPHPQINSEQRFVPPKSDADVQAANDNTVPQRRPLHGLNVRHEWRSHRLQTCGTFLASPPHFLLVMSTNYKLLVNLVRPRSLTQRRATVPPQSLYDLVCRIMRYVQEQHPQWNLFPDVAFAFSEQWTVR